MIYAPALLYGDDLNKTMLYNGRSSLCWFLCKSISLHQIFEATVKWNKYHDLLFDSVERHFDRFCQIRLLSLHTVPTGRRHFTLHLQSSLLAKAGQAQSHGKKKQIVFQCVQIASCGVRVQRVMWKTTRKKCVSHGWSSFSTAKSKLRVEISIPLFNW